MQPTARKNHLVIQKTGNELLVYDLETNCAISLNQTSFLIWEKCDGTRNPQEIGNELKQELGNDVSEDLVMFGLEQLYKENLLTNVDGFTTPFKGLSRREVIRKIGLSSLVALPIVASLTAPLAAYAQSTCPGLGMSIPGCPCAMDADCLSNNCVNNMGTKTCG